jgi:hypothetical protein
MMTLTVLFLVSTQAFQAIPYYDPQGRLPTSYHEYAATQIDAPFHAQVASQAVPVTQHGVRSPNSGSYSRLVVILVNSALYPAIQTELATYAGDLSAQGFTSKVITTSGGRAQNLKDILLAHRDSGLVGAVMVGDLPVAWWTDGSYGEDYPLDMFFTALNATFTTDGTGRYNDWTGDATPVIWMGRIYASRLTYDAEEHLIKGYFQRNHLYRTGQLPVPARGLVCNNVFFSDDHGMSDLFTNVTMVNGGPSNTSYNYKQQLLQGYSFVHLVSHSSPWVNTFFLDEGGSIAGGGSVFNFEIPALAPHAAFYFLNACMCARYTERDNLGNWYLFAPPWGQGVIASSQTMYAVDDISDIYRALGNDSCLGDAFLKWHRSNYYSFMATLILGDPTLKVNRISPPVARVGNPRYVPSARQDWTQCSFDTTHFVNGRPIIGRSQGHLRIVFDSGRIVRSDNYMTSFNGSSFSAPESIAWEDYYDLYSSACTDASGRFWVAWQSFRDYDQTGYEHFQLFSTYYYNGAWSSIQRIGSVAGYHDEQVALGAGSDNTVWAAFKSWRNGQGDIWAASASNGGAWTTPVRLTSDSLDQIDPCVVVDHANHPWVFWQSQVNGRFRIQGRTYNGSWQPIFDLDTLGNDGPPKATVDGDGNVWVVWASWQAGANHVCCACRADSAWQPVQALTSGPTNDYLPAVTTDPSGTVWVCWQSGSIGAWNIYASYYAGGWTAPEAVTDSTSDNYDPTICADDAGKVWVAWASDRRGYWNIYAAYTDPASGVEAQPTSLLPVVNVSQNPFARSVSFTGPQHFSVDVFTIDGRKLTRLDARDGKANWTPGLLPRGIYIARLADKEKQTVVKLLYIK